MSIVIRNRIYSNIRTSQVLCSGTGGSNASDGVANERLRVTGPLRPALCDVLDDADAADFVGDAVVAHVLLRRTRR